MRSILLTCLILCLTGQTAFAQSYPPPTGAQYEAPYPATAYPGAYPATTYPPTTYPATPTSQPQYTLPQSSATQSSATQYPTPSYPTSSTAPYPAAAPYPTSSYPETTLAPYPAEPRYGLPTSGAAPWVRPAGYDEPGVYRQYRYDELLPPPEEVPLLPDDIAPAPPRFSDADAAEERAADSKGADAKASDKVAPTGDASPETVKSLPLLDPFPSWLQFKDFNSAKLWSGTIQLGLNGAEGNANTFNIASGYDLKRETKQLILTTDLKYNKATSRLIETQHNAIFNGKAEWLFPESPWTAFGRTYLEYDEFKAFDLRVVTNAGAGYRLINKDRTKLTSRLGSGFSHEIGGPDDSYVPEAVMGMDFSHQFTPRQKFNAKGDYFPEWGEFTNYRVVTSADWELLFDAVANLSLKIGITDRYDATPNGLKPNDFTYSTLILWKL